MKEQELRSEYYLRNKSRLLKDHGKMAAAGREIINARYGQAFADTLLRESLAEFEGLIPVLPYIGGKQNLLTQNLIQCHVRRVGDRVQAHDDAGRGLREMRLSVQKGRRDAQRLAPAMVGDKRIKLSNDDHPLVQEIAARLTNGETTVRGKLEKRACLQTAAASAFS